MANKQFCLPANRLLNNSNLIAQGGTASLYTTGTLTPANFLDANGVSLGSTITANALGQLPDAYQDANTPFRLILKDKTGATLDGGDIDPFYFGLVAGVDATVTVGSTTTSAAGGNAAVSNGGTSQAAILNFTIPTGSQGPAGDVAKVTDRTTLAAIAGAVTGNTRYLVESGREGTFVFSSANNAANVTADPQQGVYVAPSTDTTGASGAWVRHIDGLWRPEWFGAKGDGTTNDHVAFRGLSVLGAHLGYLHVWLTPGTTYRIGKQNANTVDVDGNGPYYRAEEHPIEAIGLSSFILRGNGATLKFNDGLLYGAFNPATGLPIDDTVVTKANNAHIGHAIYAETVTSVVVENVKIDGNSPNVVLGGATSTGFFECHHDGVWCDGCLSVTIRNVEAFDLLEDGVLIWEHASPILDTDDKRPILLENIKIHDCGRSNLSLLGHNLVTGRNISSIRPGGAPVVGGGVKGSGPNTALDIEPGPGVGRNVEFQNCVFEQGSHGARAINMGANDSRDITFRDCQFIGRLYVFQARARFANCRIYGLFDNLFGNQANDADNTRFDDCYITDATKNDTPLQTNSNLMFGGSSLVGTKFYGCLFDLSRLSANMSGALTRDCTIIGRWNTTYLAAGTAVVNLSTSGDHYNLQITDAIASSAPATPYVITVTGTTTIRRGMLTSATPNIRWLNASAALGFTGAFDNSPRVPYIQTVSSAATITPAYPNDQVNVTALAAAATIANPTGPIAGWEFIVRIKDNGTARALTFDTQYRAIGVSLPTTTVISKNLYLRCRWNATDTKVDVIGVQQEA